MAEVKDSRYNFLGVEFGIGFRFLFFIFLVIKGEVGGRRGREIDGGCERNKD